MSTPEPGNPYAFARSSGRANASQTGMTLRDYFAGQALMGIAARGNINKEYYWNIAEQCYEMADAMLNERGKADA